MMDCYIEAVQSMDELIASRAKKIANKRLELEIIGKKIKAKKIQSRNEYQLNRHKNAKKYADQAIQMTELAREIHEQRKELSLEIQKLELVKNRFEVCRIEMESKIATLKKHNSFKPEIEMYRHKIVNRKFNTIQ